MSKKIQPSTYEYTQNASALKVRAMRYAFRMMKPILTVPNPFPYIFASMSCACVDFKCADGLNAIGLVSDPRPWLMVTNSSSPSTSRTGGFRLTPIPQGVPVKMMVPFCSVQPCIFRIVSQAVTKWSDLASSDSAVNLPGRETRQFWVR